MIAPALALVVYFGYVTLTVGAIANPIGHYNVSDITVSGISAGAYMAVQVHVAFSSIVNGCAVYAGGPYFCAKANVDTAELHCMEYMAGGPDVEASVSYTSLNVDKKTIDNTINLNDDKVFLFSGKDDKTVDPKVVKALETYYGNYMPATSIVTNYKISAAHTMPTLDYGTVCDVSKTPYIGKCSYEGAGEGLKTILNNDMMQKGKAISSNLLTFDQTPFYSGSDTSLDKTGYIYVPTACSGDNNNAEACHLHIAFHGCLQTLDDIDNDFALNGGYNEWAEENNIIVIYPYAVITKSKNVYNPNGCWDWWAYTNTEYALQSGIQMSFIKNIIDEVTGW